MPTVPPASTGVRWDEAISGTSTSASSCLPRGGKVVGLVQRPQTRGQGPRVFVRVTLRVERLGNPPQDLDELGLGGKRRAPLRQAAGVLHRGQQLRGEFYRGGRVRKDASRDSRLDSRAATSINVTRMIVSSIGWVHVVVSGRNLSGRSGGDAALGWVGVDVGGLRVPGRPDRQRPLPSRPSNCRPATAPRTRWRQQTGVRGRRVGRRPAMPLPPPPAG